MGSSLSLILFTVMHFILPCDISDISFRPNTVTATTDLLKIMEEVYRSQWLVDECKKFCGVNYMNNF